jgi:hypothetical protein
MDRETIINLANEADRHASKQTNDSYDWQEIRDERFAKLIVQECISIVNNLADPDSSERYRWAIQNASQELKEHFKIKQ